MNFKEDLVKTLNHEKPSRTPVYFTGIHDVGFASRPGPAFERGPAGGGYDGFGVRWVAPSSGGGAHIPAPGEFVLSDIARWREDVKFPDLENFDWEKCSAQELEGCNREEKAVDFGCGNGVFERLASLMGFEDALLSMAEDPDSCYEFFTAVTDYKIKVAEKVVKYYEPDYFTNYDDIATERSLFMSPETYRELIKPHQKRLNDAVISMGMKPIYHCCGKAEAIVEDMIDCGYIAWTSVQPSNDIVAILKKYGDKLAIIGGYDNNGLPGRPDATEEDARAEVRRCFNEYAKYDGYIFFGIRMTNTLDFNEYMKGMIPIVEEAVKCSMMAR